MTKTENKEKEIARKLASAELAVERLRSVSGNEAAEILKSAGLTDDELETVVKFVKENDNLKLQTAIKFATENKILNEKAYELMKEYNFRWLRQFSYEDIEIIKERYETCCVEVSAEKEKEKKLHKEVYKHFHKRIERELKIVMDRRKLKFEHWTQNSPKYADTNLKESIPIIRGEVAFIVIEKIKNRIMEKETLEDGRFIEKFDGEIHLHHEIKKHLQVDREILHKEGWFTYINKNEKEVKIPTKPYRYLFSMKKTWEKVQEMNNKYKYDVESLAKEFLENMREKSDKNIYDATWIVINIDKDEAMRIIEGMRNGWRKIGEKQTERIKNSKAAMEK